MPTFVLRMTAELPAGRLTNALRVRLHRWQVENATNRGWTETTGPRPRVTLTELHHVTRPDLEQAMVAVRDYLAEDVIRHRLPVPTAVQVEPDEAPPLVPREGPRTQDEVEQELRRLAGTLSDEAAAHGIRLDGTRGSVAQLEELLRRHWTTTSKRGLIAQHLRGRYTWITGYLFVVLESCGGKLLVTYDERGIGVEMPGGQTIWIQKLAEERVWSGHRADLDVALDEGGVRQP